MNVVNIRLPALRERPADILPLAKFFLDKFAEQNGVAKKDISEDAKQKIQSHHWKGNIRELENTMHRAVLVSMQDQIEADAVYIAGMAQTSIPTANKAPDPKGVSSAGTSSPQVQNMGAVETLVGRTIADVERDMIINTLDHCLGNRTHAANILGISIRTLRNKLSQYRDEGLDIPEAG